MHSKASRLMSRAQVERCASRCTPRTPWGDHVQGLVAGCGILIIYIYFFFNYLFFLNVENLLAGLLFGPLRRWQQIFCLCHLSLLCMSLGFTQISAGSLCECPRFQTSLCLPPPSLNGLNICFNLDVGFSGKLHIIMLSIDDLLMNLALSIHAIPILPPATPPGVHTWAFPFPWHSQQS